MNLLEIENKIEQIDLGYEIGQIRRNGEVWHYMRLTNPGEDDGLYDGLTLPSPLQAALVESWLLTDPDGQPDILVHGTISELELRWWLAPIIEKWGQIDVSLNGDEVLR